MIFNIQLSIIAKLQSRNSRAVVLDTGADLGGGSRGCAAPPPQMTCGFLIQLVFCKKKKNYVVYWC